MNKDIEKIIDNQKTAYIASVDEQGYPNMKAMLAPRMRNGLQEFWFTTNTSSMRVGQYRKNNKASIYFCDDKKFVGIMLTGTMEVLEDAESKEQIWRKGDTMYYKLGVTDPDYCVLKFTAEKCRCYGSFDSSEFSIDKN